MTLAENANQRILRLQTLQRYPEIKQYLALWLKARAPIWGDFTEMLLQLANLNERERASQILASWLLLFCVSGPLDDYVDEDKATNEWSSLKQRGNFVGLALIADAFNILLTNPAENLCQAAQITAHYLNRAALGQAQDIAQAQTLTEYEAMLQDKAVALTLALTEGVASLGGSSLATGLNPAFAQVGAAVGMAIQIVNDYLGIWQPEKIAKQPGGDLLQPQLTYPLFYALHTPHPFADEFRMLLAAPPPERNAPRLLEILNQIGAPQFIQAALRLHRQQAKRACEQVNPQVGADFEHWFNHHFLGFSQTTLSGGQP